MTRPTNHDLAALTGPTHLARDLEDATPVQAYRLGVECGRLSARLEALNRRLDAHLLRLGIPQEELDAAADEALSRLTTDCTDETYS